MTKALRFPHMYGAINEGHSSQFNIAISFLGVASTLYSWNINVLGLVFAQDFTLAP